MDCWNCYDQCEDQCTILCDTYGGDYTYEILGVCPSCSCGVKYYTGARSDWETENLTKEEVEEELNY